MRPIDIFSVLLVFASIESHASASRFYSDAAERDRVNSLPGVDTDLGFSMFSGCGFRLAACPAVLYPLPMSQTLITDYMHVRYVTVSEHKDRRLFYILTEAEEDPENAPLILWLNG